MSEERRVRRYLLRKSKKGKLSTKDSRSVYYDNVGIEYEHEWVARCSSFCNFISGCLKNGFPISVKRLWYSAWAFYPFFFIRSKQYVKDPVPILNHERIHIRQQRDIHLMFSLPILFVCLLALIKEWFNPIGVMCLIPFMPTFFYGISWLGSFVQLYKQKRNHSFKDIRENTCFEREAISRSTNTNYLFNRKFWAVLAYTNFKIFKNYGQYYGRS